MKMLLLISLQKTLRAGGMGVHFIKHVSFVKTNFNGLPWSSERTNVADGQSLQWAN
jgi:hypothetical protein